MSENTLLEARKAKFHYVREHVNPYPERYAQTHELCEAAKLPDGVQDVCVAGRVTAIRRMGKLSFVTLSDMEGKLQIAVIWRTTATSKLKRRCSSIIRPARRRGRLLRTTMRLTWTFICALRRRRI